MNRYRYILSLVVLSLFFIGCKAVDGPQGGGEGEVKFSVDTDVKTEIYNVSTKAGETPTYRLLIYRDQTLVKSFDDYTTIQSVKLPAGAYRFVVESGQDLAAAIDAPYFKGEQAVTIKAGETVSATITAKLANVRISTEVSQLIKDNFSDYSIRIGDLMTISKEDILAGRSLYISASSKEFLWTLTLVNNQNVVSTFHETVKDVEPCTHYKFKFDIDSAAENEGQVMLDLSVDTSVEHIDVDIDISLEKKELPYMQPTTGFKLGEQIVVNEVTRAVELKIDMFASGLLKTLKIRHTNAWLDEQRVPYTFEANAIGSGGVFADIKNAGIEWSPILTGSSKVFLDFTKLASKAPLGEYKFYITLQDQANQVVEEVLYFVVLPDQDHITKPVQYGAKYAVLNGEWCTLSVPDGLSFQYKKKSDADWTILDPTNVVMGEGKNFSARITDLQPLTQYMARTYAPASGDKQGQIVEFTTFDAPEIPNLNFDKAHSEGKYWYPNASGGNSYWATGNDGVVAGPVNMNANNTEELIDVVKAGGKAVRLRSVPITFSLSPVKFAAGSIFTGSYSTDMGNPINSVRFGRPYKGRPLALKGYYKYNPVIINNNKYNGGVSGVSGTMDRCHIYISLEDWGGSNSRPGSPRVIGYGELKSNEKQSTYKEFRIDVQYSDPSRLPTHVVIAATASEFGGLFCGGEGSEMLIDEFELIWQ